MPRRHLATLATALLLGASPTVSGAALDLVTADIRPADFAGHELDADRLARGRAIADRGVHAQGGAEAWHALSRLQLSISDEWDITAFRLYMPLAEDRVTLEGDIALHRHLRDSSWTITSGSANGEQFGIAEGRAWYGSTEHSGGPGTAFFAPTMEYLPTLAFHVPLADVVSYVDTVERGGRDFDRVFVTWGDPARPSASTDQYLVYYARDTGRLTHVECTVRDFGPFTTGAVDYRGSSSVGQVTLPRQYAMRLIALDGPLVHEVSITALSAG